MAQPEKDYLPYTAAGPYNPWLIAVIVSIATFMEVLDTTIANVALRHIAGSLSASQDESTYIITSYLVSNAIILPISGWLATVIGRKRFYMICVGIFTVSSVLCATAHSLPEILLWRVVQGLGGGGLAPVEQSIFSDTFPVRKRPQAFALYGLTIVLAPAIGPMLGGWLTDNLSWHWVFLINLPVGCLSLLLTWLFVSDSPQTIADRAKRLASGFRIDWLGFFLVVVGFGSLQIVLDRFQPNDGFASPFIVILTLICVVSLVGLVIWEIFHPEPVMNVRLLRYRSFGLSCILMFGVGFTLITGTQLLPQFSQELLGYDAATAGLTLGLAGLLTIVLMPISGIITGRVFQPGWIVFVAFAGTGLSMWYTSRFNLNVSFANLTYARMLHAIWLPFLFIPISSVGLVNIAPRHNSDAAALTNLMRNLGGSIGVSYVTTLSAYRRQFHQSRLVEHVTAYTGYDWQHDLHSIAATVARQAAMLTYNDLFFVLTVFSLLVAPVALFLPRLPKGAPAGGGH